MIAGGLALGLWAFMNNPFGAQASSPPAQAARQGPAAAEAEGMTPAAMLQAGSGPPWQGWCREHRAATAAPTDAAKPAAAGGGPWRCTWQPELLPSCAPPIRLSDTLLLTTTATAAPAIRFSVVPSGTLVYTVTFAVATRFDTLEPAISWQEVTQDLEQRQRLVHADCRVERHAAVAAHGPGRTRAARAWLCSRRRML